jgi:hypothetical protein
MRLAVRVIAFADANEVAEFVSANADANWMVDYDTKQSSASLTIVEPDMNHQIVIDANELTRLGVTLLAAATELGVDVSAIALPLHIQLAEKEKAN